MYLFDENVSYHIVNTLKNLGCDVSHIKDTFGLGILDQDFLPQIGNSDTVLVTCDRQMNRSQGKGGHGQILREYNVKALFLPKSFVSKPIGIPESLYPSVAWAQCVWMLRYWHEIDSQVSPLKNLSLAQINDRGKVERL